jgi:hypothetical protein
MENVQVIDGALNCDYAVFAFTDDEFIAVFPHAEQDVEFVEDFIRRVGAAKAEQVLAPVWARRINKIDMIGLRGTLFYELEHKKKYYPTKREAEIINNRFVL